MKPVGKPDAGNPHVRFDERGGETGRLDDIEADTAPFLDSTRGAIRPHDDTGKGVVFCGVEDAGIGV
jgi:hypothetical protein